MQDHHYWKRANYLHAGKMYEAAWTLWRIIHQDMPEETDVQTAFDVHYKLGDCYDETDRPEKAVSHYLAAYTLVKTIDPGLAALLCCGIGNTALRSGQFELAMEYLEKVWDKLPELGLLNEAYHLAEGVVDTDEERGADLLREVFYHALEQEDIEVAEVAFESVTGHLLTEKRFAESLELIHAAKGCFTDPNYVWQRSFRELEVYAQRRQRRAYLECYDREVHRLTETDDLALVNEVEQHYYAGLRALFADENEGEHFAAALEVASVDDEYYFEVLQKCYQQYTEFYRYKAAMRLAAEALALAQDFDDPYAVVDVAVDYATILYSANEAAEALALLLRHEALLPTVETDDATLPLRFYGMLTRCAHQLGESDIFERGFITWRKAGEALPSTHRFDFYFEFAQVLGGIGQVDRAWELLERAAILAEEPNKSHYFPRVRKEQAMLAFQLGHHQRGLAILDELELPEGDPNFSIDYYTLRGNLEDSLGKDAVAEASYLKADGIIDHYPSLEHHRSAILCNLGLIYHERGDFAAAEDHYLRSLAIDRELGITNYELTSVHNLGSLYLDQQRFADAATYLWEALALQARLFGRNETSGGRKFSSDEWMNTTEMLAETLVEQGQPEIALRLLVHRRVVQSGIDPKSVAQLLLPRLAEDEVLVCYSGLRREHYLFFLLDATGAITHRKIPLAEDAGLSDALALLRKVKAYRDEVLGYDKRRIKPYRTLWPWVVRYFNHLCSKAPELLPRSVLRRRDALGRRIAEQFIWPILNVIGGEVRQLLLQPDYSLGLVPFAILPDPDGQPLVSNYAVKLLAGVRATEPSPTDKLLVWGNTDYTATQTQERALADLPGAKQEGDYLRSTFPAATALVDASLADNEALLSGGEALADYRFIHYLGHADSGAHDGAGVLYFPQFPHGLLPASRLDEQRLTAELVYLAACSTGAGEAYAGWGVDSIGKVFLDAGAANVITTLWPLRDATGPELVRLLYPLLDGHTVTEALTQVQRKFLESRTGPAGRDPYFWAGLCVWGWAEPGE